MKFITPIIIWLVSIPAFNPALRTAPEAVEEICVSEEEKKLYDLIMQYRKSKKLKKIPLSAKLTKTAQTHVSDLAANFVYEEDATCNLHSWSGKGSWSPCCYTADHKSSTCMWDKPKEIAGYNSPGYEIAFFYGGGATAYESLEGWKTSSGHNGVIVNLGIWKKVEWKSIGIGIYKEYAVVWFGEMEDDVEPKVCK